MCILSKKKRINKSVDDDILELSLGSLLVYLNAFSSDIFIEKIFVLLGLIIILVGIGRAIIKYKNQKKKGLVIFFVLIGVLFLITLVGLLYRLIFL